MNTSETRPNNKSSLLLTNVFVYEFFVQQIPQMYLLLSFRTILQIEEEADLRRDVDKSESRFPVET